ncbi:MAG: hypothetical protein Q4E11_03450 [Corynebacterium sp.]|uniref:hypothetical protein n=1 Tax=Corynebacterium sp. TaxID=1720 RepID=UPI0026DB9F8B|nr:hypothetical protein [Corynebacterium sp.]MDO5029625.1 hypothetical protein [Corynebacterium sp.]
MTSSQPESGTPQRRQARTKTGNDGSISPVMAIISAVSVVLLVVLFALAATSDRVSKPQNLNGDSLGPESWETFDAYRTRADESLVRIQKEAFDLENEQPIVEDAKFWALVTFDEPKDASQAAELAEAAPSLRIASMVLGGIVTRHLPQPSPAASEVELIKKQQELSAKYAEVPLDDDSLKINGFIVYSNSETLVAVRELPYVAAVQALPSDAARGRFGIRPYIGAEFTDYNPLLAPGLSQN